MQFLEKIEKMKTTQKWIIVGGTFGLSMTACVLTAQMDGNLFSVFFSLYIPLTLSAMLLGLGVTTVLTVSAVMVSLFNFWGGFFQAWVLVVFIFGLTENYKS